MTRRGARSEEVAAAGAEHGDLQPQRRHRRLAGLLERESPTTENIEVEGSHSGRGHNPAVLYAVSDRLAQPEDAWRPFDRSGLQGLIYPAPRRAATRR